MALHLLGAAKCTALDVPAFQSRFGARGARILGPLAWSLGLAGALTRNAERLELTPTARFLASRLWSAHILEKLGRT